MSMLEPAPVSDLSRREFWLNSATQLSGYGEYHAAKFKQGLDYNPLVTFARDPFGAGERFGPLPQGQDLAASKEMGFDTDQPRLTEDQWREAGLEREGLKFSGGGTLDYERTRTSEFDRRRYNDSIVARYQGNPIDYLTGFLAQAVGSALSPESFIPFVGPAARAAMAVRLGTIGGHAAVGAIDATIGTALTDAYVLPSLARQGEDVGAADFAMDLALGAVAGTAFGAGGGWLERRRAAAESVRFTGVQTMADIHEAATAALERGEPVNVGPMFRSDPGLVERLDRKMGEVLGTEHAPIVPRTVAQIEREDGVSLGEATLRAADEAASYTKVGVEPVQPLGGGPTPVAEVPAAGEKAAPDVLARDAEHLTELPVSDAGIVQSFGALDVEARGDMLAVMGRVLEDEEVAQSVVRSLPADVVDVLSREQPAAKALLDNPAVLVDLLPTHADDLVPARIEAVDVLAPYVARAAAERSVARAQAAAVPLEAGAAGRADTGGLHPGKVTKPFAAGKPRPMDLTTTVPPEEPHPSVVAAEKSYKVIPPDWTAEQAARIKEQGLDAPDDPHMAAVEQARQQGMLREGQEGELAAADTIAKQIENEALAHEALSLCTLRFG